ncbi:phosphoribosylformylglycinamidine cyclo-ligase [Thermosyntropha sp.]|uniref:phosphoribosylformylglycinamidine cyclo-ligase n=1 Tax=Thermosyntropha sp. TaxID=2740820 RepID=UPI0025E89837|nr:phosphoribosylformylglycinamidine cyclo-ligase [Thermosyntropha sp.]MBO8158305.1 phosphoribosylformylglycinamidine cyclo-ligase [Thermosyntropha sp.]
MENKTMTYKEAGVDIDAANKSVEMIKKWVEMTKRPEVLSGIGAFGGFFALDINKYREPVLVSGTDGVGTKLKIAQLLNKHDTVGIDLVAMCVNDILVHGAEPLFFLDYIAVGKLKSEVVEDLVKGVSMGCLEAGCSLIGGETAEMPGLYGEDEYDLAGFAVGVVEKSRLIDGSRIEEGDIIIALPSSGLHSNGYSLARKVLLEEAGFKLGENIKELGKTLGEELLTPTRIYVKSVLPLLDVVEIKGMAHITGGGIPENLSRIIPTGLTGVIESSRLPILPVFRLIEKWGRVKKEEMFRTFNLGTGFLIITAPHHLDKVLNHLHIREEKPIVIGKVEKGEERVRII